MTAMTQTLPISAAMAGFSDATVWLIVAAFLFARGFIKTGLGRRIAAGNPIDHGPGRRYPLPRAALPLLVDGF
ncbi:MAG: ybhI 5 [Firmicutes bacterium]|nr:ybhI 5 [Bacillota bacterium]